MLEYFRICYAFFLLIHIKHIVGFKTVAYSFHCRKYLKNDVQKSFSIHRTTSKTCLNNYQAQRKNNYLPQSTTLYNHCLYICLRNMVAIGDSEISSIQSSAKSFGRTSFNNLLKHNCWISRLLLLFTDTSWRWWTENRYIRNFHHN